MRNIPHSVHPILSYLLSKLSEYVLKQKFKTKYASKCFVFIEKL